MFPKNHMVVRDLRLGLTSVQLWYEFGSESVGAVETKLLYDENRVVLQTKLKPVDGNQRADADSVLHREDSGFYAISFSDTQISDRLASYFEANPDRLKDLQLVIEYGKLFIYKVESIKEGGFDLHCNVAT